MHINSLPPEIRMNIFEQGKSTHPLEIGGSTLMFTISQVCAAWRAITHTYPTLWDDLRLTARSSSLKVRNLLARSDGAISITIDHRVMREGDPVTYWNILNVLVASAARFRTMRFIGPARSLRLLSRACSQHTFPHLRELVVVKSEEDIFPMRLNISIDAPNLDSLSLTGTSPTIFGNYPRLRELCLDRSGYFIYFDQPDAVLEKQFPFEILRITSSPLPLFPDLSIQPSYSSIVSLTLCRLRETDIAPGFLTRFCQLVCMPLLEHLEVSEVTGYLWNEFARSLRRSGSAHPKYPVLKSLTFRSLSLTGFDDADSLHAVQSISELRLIDVDPSPLVRILEEDINIFSKIREIRLANGEVVRISSRMCA
ncbi:hypothetical protein B0H11DRAFT_2121129 [Mycena galericulata]|nr:hypothetical protein B0H11DRAFT_2121129 [Mycena galericulata]